MQNLSSIKIYVLHCLITFSLFFIPYFLFAQAWVSVGPNDWNQAFYGDAGSIEIAVDSEDNVYAMSASSKQDYRGKVRQFNGVYWSTVGTDFVTDDGVSFFDIAINPLDDVPYIFYKEQTSVAKWTVKKYIHPNWVEVGDNEAIDALFIHQIQISEAGIPYVTYGDSEGRLVVKKLISNEWEEVGSNPISEGAVYNCSFGVVDNEVVVSYQYDNAVLVKKFDGDSWLQIGNALTDNPVYTTSLDISSDGTIYVCNSEILNGNHVKYFDGTEWVSLGQTEVSATLIHLALSPNDVPYLIFRNYEEGDKVSVKKYEDSTWSYLGGSSISLTETMDVELSFLSDSSPVVAYPNSGVHNIASFKSFNGMEWIALGAEGATKRPESFTRIAINPDDEIFMFTGGAFHYGEDGAVWHFSGDTWDKVSPDGLFPSSAPAEIGIDSNGKIYAACGNFSESIKIQVFDGTEWNTYGPDLGVFGIMYDLLIDGNDNLFIAYSDGVEDLYVKKLVDNEWHDVNIDSQPIGAGEDLDLEVSSQGDIYISYHDLNLSEVVVKKYIDAVGWELISSQGQFSDSVIFALTSNQNNELICSYVTGGSSYKILKYDGNEWGNIADENNDFSVYFFQNPSFLLASPASVCVNNDGVIFAAFPDKNNEGKLTVKRYSGGVWETAGFSELSAEAAKSISLVTNSGGEPIVAYMTPDGPATTFPSLYGQVFVKAFDFEASNVAQPKPQNQQLIVYPNPANDQLTVNIENNILQMRIYNATGKVVLMGSENQIDLSSLRHGLYFISIILENEETVGGTFIKQ